MFSILTPHFIPSFVENGAQYLKECMLSLFIGYMKLLLFVTIFGLDIILFSSIDCGAIILTYQPCTGIGAFLKFRYPTDIYISNIHLHATKVSISI
jgi:hypothetical protein